MAIIRHHHFQLHLAQRQRALAAVAPRAPRTDTAAQRFEQAMLLFEQGRWPQAFDKLSGLANAGHPSAARIALMLVHRGASLFGGAFVATPQERARWQQVGE
jgi:hypothetical protein